MRVSFSGSQFRIPTRDLSDHIHKSADIHMIFVLDHDRKLHPNMLATSSRMPLQKGRTGELYYEFTDQDPAKAERFRRALRKKEIPFKYTPDPAADVWGARARVDAEEVAATRETQKSRLRRGWMDGLFSRIAKLLRV